MNTGLAEKNIAVTQVKEPWYKKSSFQKKVFVCLALGPAYLVYVVMGLYPNLLSAYYSLFNWDGLTPKKFIGLKNYVDMIHDQFLWRDISHNLYIMAVVPVSIVLISLILAYLLVNKPFVENKAYKVIYFFPNVLSTVVIALLWAFIFDGTWGILNSVLRIIGIDVGNFYWLGNSNTALWAVMIPMIWHGVGFYVIIFMNAMRSIPDSLYESAVLDGANHMTRLFKITIPLIKSVISVAVLFTILGSIKGFEMIMVLTQGGPAGATEVVGYYMFSQAFASMSITGDSPVCRYGYASAIGMLLFVILVLAKVIIDRCFKSDSIQY